MGFSEIPQPEGGFDSDSRKWIISGIALRAPLKSIFTRSVLVDHGTNGFSRDADEECSTTPTGEESRIPTKLACPPAPRKRRPSLKWKYGGHVREFFTPPDLETLFVRHA